MTLRIQNKTVSAFWNKFWKAYYMQIKTFFFFQTAITAFFDYNETFDRIKYLIFINHFKME